MPMSRATSPKQLLPKTANKNNSHFVGTKYVKNKLDRVSLERLHFVIE